VPSLLKVDMATWIARRANVEQERHASRACIQNATVISKVMTGYVNCNLVVHGTRRECGKLNYLFQRGVIFVKPPDNRRS